MFMKTIFFLFETQTLFRCCYNCFSFFCCIGFCVSFVVLKKKYRSFVGKSIQAFMTTAIQRVGFSEEDIIPFLTNENLLGGGSGQGYKVKVKMGHIVAVKKLRGGSGTQQPDTESVFESEIETLGRNIIYKRN
jgi:hypothetical protein